MTYIGDLSREEREPVKGIPVYEDGEPLRPVVVIAGSVREAHAWARVNQINPRSRNVVIATGMRNVEGLADADVALWDEWHTRREGIDLDMWRRRHKALYPDSADFRQYGFENIQPDVRKRG